jgi:hypothetical protein
MSDELTLLLAMSFDHPVFVEQDILGAQRSIAIGSHRARLEFPCPRESNESCALAPPLSAGTRLESCLSDGWGIEHDRTSMVEIYAVLVAVPVTATISFPMSSNQIGGTDVQEILQQASDWFDAFCHWLWVLSAQPLDPSSPDPKVLHRRSTAIYFAASHSNIFSLPSCGSPALVVRVDRDSAVSERLISQRVLDRALEDGVTSAPPFPWELLSSARLAGRRGDKRRALVDAGTAAEAALTNLLSLSPTHGLTLGGLVAEAERRNVTLPSDTKPVLVRYRNDAVHRGTSGSFEQLCRAIDIAEELVALQQSRFIKTSTLRAVNRPQRHDLTILRPRRPQPMRLRCIMAVRRALQSFLDEITRR